MSNDNKITLRDVGKTIVGILIFSVIVVLFKSCAAWMFDLDSDLNLDMTSSVQKCIIAIEDRNFTGYRAAFEPSAVIHPTSPGLSVHFIKPITRIKQKGDVTGIIQLSSIVKVDGSDLQWPIEIEINVVKVARPTFGSLGLKKWYIAGADVSVLPFKYSY